MKIMSAFAVGLAFVGVLSAAPAQAQNRAFVSATGLDTNTCSFTAPCRSLQHAHDTVTANGEIEVLDPAGYGTLMINRAINIYGHGYTHISVGSGGTGITINATDPTAAINLSGLIIDGQGSGATGIQFNNGTSLTIENCVIRNMTGDGLDFSSTTAISTLTVSHSLMADNGGNGIGVQPTGSAEAVFNRVEVNNNSAFGIVISGGISAGANTINATVSESIATGNGQGGLHAVTTPGKAPTNFMVSHSVVTNNLVGVDAAGVATLRLTNSTVTGNANGWSETASNLLYSYGDNYIDGNTRAETAPTKINSK